MGVGLQNETDDALATDPGHLRLSGIQAGWKGLLLCEFDQPANAEPFWTVPAAAQAVVLVTAGTCEIECQTGGQWRSARYTPGSLGFTRPGESAHLRWRNAREKRTLHVHVPVSVMNEVARHLPADRRRSASPDVLVDRDETLSSIMLAARTAAANGAPDLYAQSAAYTLATHMLLRHDPIVPRRAESDTRRLARADELLHDAIAGTVSLAALADAAGLGRFQLLRAAHAGWGETPMRRLTRLRMERACKMLAGTNTSITAIALDCGYGSSAHFATAFRRHVGITPGGYRAQSR